MHVVGVALIIEFCDHNTFSKSRILCKESLINDENWKNACTKGYAAVNVIPDYPPYGVYRGQHRGFFCISHRFVPQGRGISSFSEPRRLKEAY